MKKKFLTFMCIGIMTLSFAGCDKKEESGREDRKQTTEEVTEIDLPGFGDSDDEENADEEITEEKVEEEKEENLPIEEDDVTVNDNASTNASELFGDDRTGYAKLQDGWKVVENVEGEKYSIQSVSPAEDCIITLLDNDYEFDENEYSVEDPADVVVKAYIEQYGSMEGVNEGVSNVEMAGMDFYLTVDVLPEGTYKDYEYVLYTYVAYENDRFYTVIVEGRRDLVEDISDIVEATYTLNNAGNSDHDTTQNENDSENDSSDITVSANSDWETYYACVDGKDYILPCDFSVFESDGWSVEASGDGELIEYEDYCYAFIEKDDVQMCIVVANKYDKTDITISEGQVVGVVFDYNVDEIMCYIEGGIRLNTTYDEVIEAFGTPDEIYEDDEEDYKKITYYGATYSIDMYTSLDIILEDGVVTEISMIHW